PLHVTQRPGDALIDGEAPQHTVDLREQRTRLRPRRLRRQGVEVDGLLSSEAQGAQKPSASQSRAHEANDDGSEPAPKRSRLPEPLPTPPARHGPRPASTTRRRAAPAPATPRRPPPRPPPPVRAAGGRGRAPAAAAAPPPMAVAPRLLPAPGETRLPTTGPV